MPANLHLLDSLRPRWLRAAAVAASAAALAGLSRPADGQPVVTSAEGVREQPDALVQRRQDGTPPPLLRRREARPPLFRAGPLAIRPSVDLTWMAASGLKTPDGAPASTHILTVAAAVEASWGDHWQLEYAPAWNRYSNPLFRQSTSQHATLYGRGQSPDLSVSFLQDYAQMDTSLVEAGRQARQQTSFTRAGILAPIGNAMAFEVTAEQRLTFTERLADIYQWSASPFFHFYTANRLRLSAGSDLGYVLVYHAPDVAFARPSVQASWHASPKITFDASAGADEWRFVGGNRKTLSGLFYRGRATYRPFKSTEIAAGAERAITAAPFRDRAAQTERYTLHARQQLVPHLVASAGAEEQWLSYLSPAGPGRRDHLVTIDAALTLSILKRGTLSAIWRRMRDHSNVASYQFSSTQFGIEASFRY